VELVDFETVASGIAATFSLVAAVLWWQASRISIPPFPDVGLDSYSIVFEPVRNALAEGARRNAAAALVSGLAAAAACVAFITHIVAAAS
jgi:hypothetical protein